jgi:NADP-dependent 3-hydroxy acid dehydrogenase YdfG
MIIHNKTAIITGASKGIGKAIAIGLAQMNCQTILIGRNKNDLKSIQEEMLRSGCSEPAVFALDITDSAKVKETVIEIVRKFGQIDILVNNAGIHFNGTLELPGTGFQKNAGHQSYRTVYYAAGSGSGDEKTKVRVYF